MATYSNIKEFVQKQKKLIKASSPERKLEEKKLREQLEREYWAEYRDQLDEMEDGSDYQGYDIEEI